MKTKMNRMVGRSLLGLLLLTGCIVTAWAAATKTSFTETDYHVAWLAQDPPEATPSGNLKIRGWQHLYYDDATDDRLDGYDTVEANATITKDGLVVVSGTFTVREKLDNLTLNDLANGNFQLGDVKQGRILWQGTFHQGQDGGTGVAHNDAGMTVFYYFAGTANPNVGIAGGSILNPHSD